MKKSEHFFIELCRQMILLTSPEVPQSFRSWKTVFQSIGIRSVSWLDCATWRFRPLFWYVLMHSMELSVASWGVPPESSSSRHHDIVKRWRLPGRSSLWGCCQSSQVQHEDAAAGGLGQALKWKICRSWPILKRTNGGFRTMLGESYPLVNTHSYWKLWFIVDLPIKNGDFP